MFVSYEHAETTYIENIDGNLDWEFDLYARRKIYIPAICSDNHDM